MQGKRFKSTVQRMYVLLHVSLACRQRADHVSHRQKCNAILVIGIKQSTLLITFTPSVFADSLACDFRHPRDHTLLRAMPVTPLLLFPYVLCPSPLVFLLPYLRCSLLSLYFCRSPYLQFPPSIYQYPSTSYTTPTEQNRRQFGHQVLLHCLYTERASPGSGFLAGLEFPNQARRGSNEMCHNSETAAATAAVFVGEGVVGLQ